MQNHQSALDSFMENKAIQELEDAWYISRLQIICSFREYFEDALEDLTRISKQIPIKLPCTEES